MKAMITSSLSQNPLKRILNVLALFYFSLYMRNKFSYHILGIETLTGEFSIFKTPFFGGLIITS